jgi:hypothetical protein
MDIRPSTTQQAGQGKSRGSGPGARKRRSDALEPRKDVIFRLPEALAHQLKVVAACEGITVQDFCEEAIIPKIQQTMKKHELSAEQIAR